MTQEDWHQGLGERQDCCGSLSLDVLELQFAVHAVEGPIDRDTAGFKVNLLPSEPEGLTPPKTACSGHVPVPGSVGVRGSNPLSSTGKTRGHMASGFLLGGVSIGAV